MLSLGEMVVALEGGGLEVLDVEALRRHYALTLRAWVRNLEEHWDEAVAAHRRRAAPGSGGCTWPPARWASRPA